MSAPTRTAARAGLWQRHRTTVLIAVALLLLTALIAWANGRRTAAPLDPDNPSDAGARAVARVLADEGVDVEVVRGADAFERTTVDADTTVVVTSTEQLGATTVARLDEHRGDAVTILVGPPPEVTDALDLGEGTPVPLDEVRTAQCDEASVGGLELDAGTVVVDYPTSQGCFPGPAGFALARARADLWLLGGGAALSNDLVLEADNAAVALRLLGARERLVWYVPDATDLPAGEGVGVVRFLPAWVWPGLWLAGIVALAVVWWRGRRLGPLVVEPLPVVVKAIETTQSRGRLYRRAGDRAHAAHALRVAAAERLAATLHLPAHARTDEVVRAAAAATERPEAEVRALLEHDTPPGDKDLIMLAQRLAELESEVRRR